MYENGKIDFVVSELKKKNLAYEQNGALWFRATKFGADKDRVIIKSSGEPTYRLPDIAYHITKYERGYDYIIDIFGADHHSTYPDVLAGLKALEYDTSKVRVFINQFVTLVQNGEKVKMSTRKANFTTLDELMDEVGVDVTRYFFLMRSMSSHLNFDLGLAKTESDENPVYYVQYAHARISSILRHGEEKGFGLPNIDDVNFSLLIKEEEIDLIKQLLQFPALIQSSLKAFEIYHICRYLEDLASIFHRFYHHHRVITDDIELSNARLILVSATQIVLRKGLDLLAIVAPEKM